VMSWTVWYIQAILQMARAEAEGLLVRLLSEPEYEFDAAWGLFQMARTEDPSPVVWPRNWPMRKKDVSLIWKARDGQPEVEFVEPLRTDVATLVKNHIEALVGQRAVSEHPSDYDHRLKQLAVALAELDGKASANLVLDILNMPETGKLLYGAWPSINGLEALLMQGVVLPSAKTWEIVEPIIQHARSQRWNNQELALLTHVAGIVLFTDDARRSIARIRELLRENLFSVEGIRSLAGALGYSRCDEAVGLLRELAEDKVRAQYLGDAWVNAVAQLDTQESRRLLLSFVDPSLPPVPTELIAHYDGKLVNKLTEIAQRDVIVQRLLFELVNSHLSAAQATLLGKVLVNMGTTDAILRALELLKDDGTGGGSYELHKAIEEMFVEHRPYQGSSNMVTMVPRSSNAIRSKLLDMVQNDPQRRKSALALLNEIEKWRMWHGRPDGEPRSPTLKAGFLWPCEVPSQ
jgi:NACHT conflict system protein